MIILGFCLEIIKYIIATGICTTAIATKKLKDEVSSIIPFVKVSDNQIAIAVIIGIIIVKLFKFFILKSLSNAVNTVPIIVTRINIICNIDSISLFNNTEKINVYIGYVAVNTLATLKFPYDKA